MERQASLGQRRGPVFSAHHVRHSRFTWQKQDPTLKSAEQGSKKEPVQHFSSQGLPFQQQSSLSPHGRILPPLQRWEVGITRKLGPTKLEDTAGVPAGGSDLPLLSGTVGEGQCPPEGSVQLYGGGAVFRGDSVNQCAYGPK